jgi:hypothetical protein
VVPLFQEAIINLRHPPAFLAAQINWDFLAKRASLTGFGCKVSIVTLAIVPKGVVRLHARLCTATRMVPLSPIFKSTQVLRCAASTASTPR